MSETYCATACWLNELEELSGEIHYIRNRISLGIGEKVRKYELCNNDFRLCSFAENLAKTVWSLRESYKDETGFKEIPKDLKDLANALFLEAVKSISSEPRRTEIFKQAYYDEIERCISQKNFSDDFYLQPVTVCRDLYAPYW